MKSLTIPEAAEHFKVSTATIRRWIRSGRVSSQLTLGPFGEQWMVDPDGLREESRESSGYIPVEKLVMPDRAPASPPQQTQLLPHQSHAAPDQSLAAPHQSQATLDQTRTTPNQIPTAPHQAQAASGQSPAPPDQEVRDCLLKEAEQALREAWLAREMAEKELAELRQSPPDLMALRSDLEGSERQISCLRHQISQLEASQEEAWQDTRTALKALHQAYQQNEELGRRLQVLERESECFRRTLAQRLGLDWQEFDTLQLFLRWESQFSDFNSSGSLERVNWSNFRRQAVTEDLQDSAG